MLDNHLYNLHSVITEESRSLWRLKDVYKKDAKDCGDCQKLCEELIKHKEEDISKLQAAIKKHL